VATLVFTLDTAALEQCFSTTKMRPGTETWRPSYRDLKCFLKLQGLQNSFYIDVNSSRFMRKFLLDVRKGDLKRIMAESYLRERQRV
jgi:hypothetical protein